MRLRQHHWPINIAWMLVRHAIRFAQVTEETTGSGSKDLLDKIDQAMTRHHMFRLESQNGLRNNNTMRCDNRIRNKYSKPVLWKDTFLALTVRSGLTMYVLETVHENRSMMIKKEGKPLLYYAYNTKFEESIRPDLVRLDPHRSLTRSLHVDGFNKWLHTLHNPLEDTAK